MEKIMLIFLLLAKNSAGSVDVQSKPLYGDHVLPEYDESEDQDRLPGDNVVPHLPVSPLMQKVLGKADDVLSTIDGEQTINEDHENSTVEPLEEPARVLPKHTKKEQSVSPPPPVQPPAVFSSRNAQVFAENAHFAHKLAGVPTVTLPSNSTAMATIIAGLKVRPGSQMRLPVKLDYAFLGPNKAVVELVGCEVFVTVSSDLNVSRLYGEVANLSCRAPKGETFNVPFKAHLVDQTDNYVGVEGTTVLNGKIDAALMAFLSDGTTAFGKAMAAAQVTTKVQATRDGEGVAGANVSGDRNAYVAGQTIAGATGRFLNWWVDFYQGLQPTVEVASGRKVFLLTDGEYQIPRVFFASTGDALLRVNTAKTLMVQGK